MSSSTIKPVRRTRRVRNVESGGGILAVLSNQPPAPSQKEENNGTLPTSIPVKPNKLKQKVLTVKKEKKDDNKNTSRLTLSPAPTTTSCRGTSKHKDDDTAVVPDTVNFSPKRSKEVEGSDIMSEVTMDTITRQKVKNTTKEDVISPLSTASSPQESDQDSVESGDESDEQSLVGEKQDDFFSEEEVQEDEEASSSEEEGDDDSPLKQGVRKQCTQRKKLFLDDDSDEEFDYDNDDEYDPNAEASDEELDEDDDESDEFELDDDDIRITQKRSPTKFVAKGVGAMIKSEDETPSSNEYDNSSLESEALNSTDDASIDNQISPSKEGHNSNMEELVATPNHSTESSYNSISGSKEARVTVVEILDDSLDDESIMEVECDEDSLHSEERQPTDSFDEDDGPMEAYDEEPDADEGSVSARTSQSQNDTFILSIDEAVPHLDSEPTVQQARQSSLDSESNSSLNSFELKTEKVEKTDSAVFTVEDSVEDQTSVSCVASSTENSFVPANQSNAMKMVILSPEKALSKSPINSKKNYVVSSEERNTPINQIATTLPSARPSNSNEIEVNQPRKEEENIEIQSASLNMEKGFVGSPDETTGMAKKFLKVDLDSKEKSLIQEGALTEHRPPHRNFQRTRSEGLIRQGQWTIGSRIGTGSFGVVHVGMNHRNGSLMAVKSIHMMPEIMTDIRREIDFLKSLKHVNIVRYYGAEITGNDLHIFQEWVAGGSVSDLLSKFGAFPFPVIQSYAEQALCGLAFLHTNSILHRDVKGSNLLVTDSGVVKLADFGGSKRMREFHSDMMMSMTMRGTPYFMAPEVFEQKYSAKADVWAVGCVLYQMATASVPWKILGFNNPFALCRHLQGSEGPPALPRTIPATDVHVLNHFLALLASCFHRNPFDRPSILDLLQDPFFMEKEYLSDDEHIDSSGLFSPDVLRSRAARRSSPNMSFIKAKALESSPSRCRVSPMQTPPRPRRNSVGPSTSPFMSPPLPKRCDRDAPHPSKPYSPAKDTSDWPSWAKQKYSEATRKAKETSLLDSLAYSTDSTAPTTEDPMQGSSGQSFLKGLEFLSVGNSIQDSSCGE